MSNSINLKLVVWRQNSEKDEGQFHEYPLDDINVVEKELISYGHGLIDRPRILVMNKKELIEKKYLKELTENLDEY